MNNQPWIETLLYLAMSLSTVHTHIAALPTRHFFEGWRLRGNHLCASRSILSLVSLFLTHS